MRPGPPARRFGERAEQERLDGERRWRFLDVNARTVALALVVAIVVTGSALNIVSFLTGPSDATDPAPSSVSAAAADGPSSEESSPPSEATGPGNEPSDGAAGPAAVEHVVQPGETLQRIASAHGVTVDELAQHNGIENIDLIYVGMVLLVPGAESTAP